MAPLSGNSSAQTTFRDTIEAHIEQLKGDFGLHYIVGNCVV